MKKIFIIGSLILCSLTSCNKEQFDGMLGSVVDMTFGAGYEMPQNASANSKSFVCSDWFSIWWSAGDEIAIFSDTDATPQKFVNTDDDGPGATFVGRAATAHTYSTVYPYSKSDSICSDGRIVADFPATQTLAEGKTVAYGSLLAVARNSGGSSFSFKNVFSLISVVVPEDDITSISIEGNNGEILSGKISIDVSDRPTYSVISDGKLTVTLLPAGNSFVKGQTYAVAVLPVNFSKGFTIVFENSQSKAAYKSYLKPVSAERNKLLTLNIPGLSWYDEWIRTPEQLKSFLANADKRPQGWTAVLGNDIDMTGIEYAPVSDYKADFNGRGYSILLPTASAPLFSSNSGKIRNLCVKPADTYTQTNPKQLIYGVVVNNNRGTIDNVENDLPVSMSSTNAISGAMCLAGIAAVNSGTITKCTNKAAITAETSKSADGASGLAGIVGYNSGKVSDCTNEAEISFKSASLSGKTEIEGITAPVPAIGGICAYGAPGFELTGCNNQGAIKFSVTAGDKNQSNPDFSRVSIGGIAGGPCGLIKNCENTGKITVEADNSTKGTAYSTAGFIVCVGGIGGSDVFFTSKTGTPANTTYDNCTNYGIVSVYSDFSSNNSTVGGIVGWPAQEIDRYAADYDKWIQGCTNYGTIEVSGTGKFRIGGINGGNGKVRDCINRGDISLASSLNSGTAAGGVSGYVTWFSRLLNSVNLGNVTATGTVKAVGGLIGNVENYDNKTDGSGEGCSVNCTVTHSGDASDTATGIVIGLFNGDTGRIFGSESNRIHVFGKVNGTMLSQYNYSSYLNGTAQPNKWGHIYAQYGEVYIPSYIARGTIMYTDNSPAVGVTVSDGFNVTVTDQDGNYYLKTSSDTWYIYFSYPSDAIVTKNYSTGCPDFFQRYDSKKEEYNFTLTRQAVENDFKLVALADPQAHYQIYVGGGTKTETDRFKDETVPAVNTAIAGQSNVYGVTLGDLVYSEKQRNSEGGMTVMRNHCKGLNFPLFQTMGNHDYTYCYSDYPISTDATSSTIYLKLQRAFEDCFGPVNYSFNRGNVHIVCMRNINFDDIPNNPQTYHGGFTDSQLSWLKADLANVSKDKMVILCVHIPFDALEDSSDASVQKDVDNAKEALRLLEQYPNSTVFSGHTHSYRGVPNTCGTSLYEHVHSAVCGQWWWSNVESDGCPNGYTIYDLNGNNIVNAKFKGVNSGLEDSQIRIYKGNMSIGNKVLFQMPFNSNTYLINVFNGDNRWNIRVYEDGVDMGSPTYIPNKRYKYTADEINVSKNNPIMIPSNSSQDWWCIGFFLDYREVTSSGFQADCYHMWKYVAKSPSAKIKVEATDPYGNTYTCEDLISDGKNYPSWMKSPR